MKIKTPIKDLVRMKIDTKAKPQMQQQSQVQFGITVPGVVEDNVPEEFVMFMDYCRDLKFEEKPDYNYLRKLFKDLFNRNGYEYDFIYDWITLDRQKRKS